MAGSTTAGVTTICRVAPYVTNSGNGSNWSGQAMSLTTALSNVGCDEIWVKAGIYTPTTGSNQSASFTINRSVKIYGGFAGTESVRDARDPATNLTVLSGDLNGDDAADPANSVENSYHVVRVDGSNLSGNGNAITASTVLDGFTISGGNASSYAYGKNGGGLYCDGSYQGNCSPTISNVIFSGNSAVYDGGAMYNYPYKGIASPTLSNVSFSGNRAAGAGGAIYNHAYNGISSPILSNVSFSGNDAYEGGAVYNNAYNDGNGGTSSPTFSNVTFSANTAYYGGAVYNDAYTDDAVSNPTDSSPTFSNVTFSGNHATLDGGVVYNDAYVGTASPTFNNVTFSDNSAGTAGGSVIYNSTYNSGPVSPVMNNAIVWGNGASPIVNEPGTTTALNDSVLQGSCPGRGTCSGNMVYDAPLLGPLQNNGGATQTMLPGVGSPAIDAGNNATCEATDQRGVARSDGHCDIGAVEVLPDLIFADGFEPPPATWEKGSE